jgi:hypothetical protein
MVRKRTYDKDAQLHRAKEKAKSLGGECLSNEYIRAKDKLQWKCKRGHIWPATFDNIVNNSKWCPYCAGKAPLTLTFIKQFANKKGGRCLAAIFSTGRDMAKWQCEKGHIFCARIQHILNDGSWCPECRNSTSENICRKVFEIFFDCPFKKCRPNWLKSVKNGRLELDGYNETLSIAFEYQGPHHYINFYNSDQFEINQKNDALKRNICKEKGITLIEIPHMRSGRNLKPMIKYICDIIISHGYTLNKEIKFKYSDI